MDKPTFLYCTWAATATVTPTNSAAGFTPGDILFATEDTTHRFATNGYCVYTIDTGVAITADAFAIIGSALHGQVFSILGDADNSGIWTTVLLNHTLSADSGAAWAAFPAKTFRYWQFVFVNAPSNMEIAHICLCAVSDWPWLEEDWDPDSLTVDGSILLSSSGYFAGGTTQSVMREMPISPGAVTPDEYAVIKAFADTVIRNKRGTFFVPDVSAATVYFGYIDNDTFSAPYRNGLREVAALKFITRAV